MSFFEVLQYLLFALIVYGMIYALVDRICKCCEQCAMTKAYGEFVQKSGKVEVKNAVQSNKVAD